jgi:hypothetical protein
MAVKIEQFIELTDAIRDARGEETTRISFRKMRVGDLRVFDESKGEQDAMINLVAKLASLPPSSVEAIALDDWPKVMEKVNGFLLSFKAKTEATSPT